MKSIVYIRTSTQDQNPKNQLADIMIIAPKDSIIYEERQSAWKDHIKQRPKLEEIVSLVKKGKITDIYVWDLDRLYRRRLMTVEFMKFCKAYNCRVHSYRQHWLKQIEQIPSPWNEIMYDQLIQIIAWLAEEESNKKSERIKAAVRRRKDITKSYRGKIWGRPRAKVNKYKILALRNQGKSLREIGKELGVSYGTIKRYLNDNLVKD